MTTFVLLIFLASLTSGAGRVLDGHDRVMPLQGTLARVAMAIPIFVLGYFLEPVLIAIIAGIFCFASLQRGYKGWHLIEKMYLQHGFAGMAYFLVLSMSNMHPLTIIPFSLFLVANVGVLSFYLRKHSEGFFLGQPTKNAEALEGFLVPLYTGVCVLVGVYL